MRALNLILGSAVVTGVVLSAGLYVIDGVSEQLVFRIDNLIARAKREPVRKKR